MYRFQRIFSVIVVSAMILTACKSETKKDTAPIVEKFQGIVSRAGNHLIISDCGSNRFVKLPLSAQDSLGASPYAVVSYTTDSVSGERTILTVGHIADPNQLVCKRSVENIALLQQNGRVVAVDNNREIKLTIDKDRIEVQLASGEIIPFNYIDAGQVQDKYILMSSTLSSDYQSDLRIIVSSYPVSEEIESFHFYCIIELNQKRMEGIFNL